MHTNLRRSTNARLPSSASLLSNKVASRAVVGEVHHSGMGEPMDIAMAALFLAGPGGRYINGHIIAIDGGFLIS
jgi:NAD(P)-dependent dehydrogenase (short-subunit alcohol dehydrogenase family)